MGILGLTWEKITPYDIFRVNPKNKGLPPRVTGRVRLRVLVKLT